MTVPEVLRPLPAHREHHAARRHHGHPLLPGVADPRPSAGPGPAARAGRSALGVGSPWADVPEVSLPPPPARRGDPNGALDCAPAGLQRRPRSDIIAFRPINSATAGGESGLKCPIRVTVSERLVGPRWIIHFPTKKHGQQPSQMEWIRSGLKDLVRVVREHGIRSVALPPLGCGNGGLDWGQVRKELEAAAAEIPDVEILVHEPSAEYYNAPRLPASTASSGRSGGRSSRR